MSDPLALDSTSSRYVGRADDRAKVNQHFVDLSNMAPQLTESVPRILVE